MTRSSFLLTLGARDGGADRLQYSDGPPCEAGYEDFTALLEELTRMGGYGGDEPYARNGI